VSELVVLEDGIYEKVDRENLVKEITDEVMEMIDGRSKSTDSK
jgi:hypothetical protein